MDDLNFLKHLLISFLFLVLNSITFGLAQSNKPYNTTSENLCNLTTYAKTCHNTLDPLINPNNTYASGVLYNISVNVAKRELLIASTNFDNTTNIRKINDTRVLSALQSCHQILDLALYYLDWAIPKNVTNDLANPETREHYSTWISGVGSLLETCKDELADDGVKEVVVKLLENSTETVTNSLDIMHQIIIHSNTQPLDMDKTTSYKSISDWPPTWLSGKDRMLLEDPKVANGPNIVVASDGSGKYKTITEALRVVPRQSAQKFIIYVKKGVYVEHVIVEKDKWNVVIYGDGMDKTIVSGNRNNAAGVSTFQSATLSVFGKGFVAKDMAFENTAGPKGGQAVALLSTADQSVFYRCRIAGYQDTLYTHSMIQFYRECKIYGTIDFIFGKSAVVIQGGDIIVRRPLPGHRTIITAQGKDNAGSNSAISIQNCRIISDEDLTGVTTYLGRPWRAYSTTIYMKCFMGKFINPQGWLSWTSATPPKTIYYAEYMNYGPGANTVSRVKWEGVRKTISVDEANRFIVRSLLRGNEWIQRNGVPSEPGL